MLTKLAIVAFANYALAYDYTTHVNPLIGTANGGHVFPGATIPFGMAKPGADTSGANNQGGFNSGNYPVLGFSQMHDDGTGGGQSLGNFPIFPYTGCEGNQIANCPFDRDSRQVNSSNPKASPGYFSLDLPDNIQVELTSTRRTALHRYTYKDGAANPVLNIELTDLSLSRHNGGLDIDKANGRVTGQGNFNPSFGVGTYDLYFCADVKGASIKDNGIYVNTRAGPGDTLNMTDIGQYTPPQSAGALLMFDSVPKNGQLEVRVGMSYISRDQACDNAQSEAGDFDFDKTHQASVDMWNQYLGNMEVGNIDKQNSTDLELFYSSLYRTMINPQNNTGENPLWDSDEPNFTSYYCIWDTFRTTFPVLGVVAPNAEIEMMKSLLDIQKNEGWLPDCRMTTNKGYTQGGSNADNVISDVYLKGIGQNDLDWESFYQAMLKDAEYEPPNWSLEGRGGLESWKNMNYIPAEDFDILGTGLQTRSASRTVEYSYNDFCISQVAKGLKKTSDCKKYLKRSGNWLNVWNKDQQSDGFTGFIMPKYSNGTWNTQDPRHCTPAFEYGQCYLNPGGGEFYEASSWTYSLLMSHDYAQLVGLLGGVDETAKRLDAFFHQDFQDVSDEVGWMNIYVGHYTGNPTIATDRIHELIPSVFNATDNGLPDNDDSGAMGAFVAMNMAGFYPNAGQDVYLLSSPYFQTMKFHNEETGKTAKIVADGLSDTNKYIQSAKLNGRNYNKAYITHDFFLSGDILEFTMGSKPGKWGTKELPPSVSTGGYKC